MLSLTITRLMLNSTSRYLDALLKTDNLYLEQIVRQINLAELQLSKANSFDTLYLNLSITNILASSNIYKRD